MTLSRILCALSLLLLASVALAAPVDLSKSHTYSTANGFCVTNAHFNGERYSACYQFDSQTGDFRLRSYEPSGVSDEMEGYTGVWVCRLYTGGPAAFPVEIKPWGNAVVLGGMVYTFLRRDMF